MDSDDQRYVVSALEGDTEAYGRLIDTYQGMVFSVALNVTGNYADSEDVLQDVFLRAYEKLRTLSDPAHFGAWLYRLSRNTAVQFLRRNRNVAVVPALEDDALEQLVSDVESPVEAYARRELSNLLWSEVAELPANTREAIMLYYAEGFSVRRAAQFVGISEAAFKMRLKYGREKLRESMLERIGPELRSRQPGADTRNRIIAALPLTGAPLMPGVGAGSVTAGKAGVLLLGLTAKQIAVLVAIVLGCAFIAGIWHLRTKSASRAQAAAMLAEDRQLENADALTTGGAGNSRAPGVGSRSATAQRFSISGQVRDRSTSLPVEGIRVVLEQGGTRLHELTTSHDGRYEMRDVPTGRYWLYPEASTPELAERYYISRFDSRILVTLARRDALDLDLRLLPATSIAGKVIDTNDMPVSGSRVLVMNPASLQVLAEKTAGTDGRFRLGGLRPGGYVMTCSARGFNPVFARDIQATEDRPADNMVLQLVPGAGASISGRVVNKKGQPIERYLVTCREFNTHTELSAITDKEGRFAIAGICPGPVKLEARPHSQHREMVLKPNHQIRNVDLLVDQQILGGTMSGVMVDERGMPVSGGRIVALIPEKQWSYGETCPDSQGRFWIGNLQPGAEMDLYYETQSKQSSLPFDYYKTTAVKVKIPATDLRVQLVPQDTGSKVGSVRGRVLDRKTGLPVPRFTAAITLNPALPPQHEGWKEDKVQEFWNPYGVYEIRDYDCGLRKVALYVEAPGYVGKHVEVDTSRIEQEDIYLGSGAYIEGEVLNTKGQAVRDARVYLTWLRDNYTFTDEAGRFRLDQLWQARSDMVCVSHPDYAFMRQQVSGISENTHIRDMRFSVSTGGNVMGAVIGPDGKPARHDTVTVAGGRLGSWSARTDSKGIYCVERILAGPYRVHVQSTLAYRDALVKEGETFYADFGVSGAKVTGKVRLNAKPLTRAEIVLGSSPESVAAAGAVAQCSAGPGGEYAIENVAPGKYYLMVFPERNRRLCSVPVEVEKRRDVAKDLDLSAGMVAGRVIAGANGGAAAGAEVTIYETRRSPAGADTVACTPDRSLGFVRTDSQGTFSFSDLAAGDYLVYAIAQGQSAGVFGQVSLREGATRAECQICLKDQASLRVKAVDAQLGSELTLKGEVALQDAKGRVVSARVSGRTPAVVEGIPAGIWSVGGVLEDDENNDYVSPMVSGIEVKPGEITELVLQLRRAVDLDAKVIDAEGRPVPGFSYMLYDASGARFPDLRVREGAIHSRVPPGQTRVVISRAGKLLHDGVIDIPTSTARRFDTEIRLK